MPVQTGAVAVAGQTSCLEPLQGSRSAGRCSAPCTAPGPLSPTSCSPAYPKVVVGLSYESQGGFLSILRWQDTAPVLWLVGEALWGGVVGLGVPRRLALVSRCWMQGWGRERGKQLGQPHGRDSTQDGSTITAGRVLGCPMPPAWLCWSGKAVSVVEEQLVTTEQLEVAVAQLCHFCSGTRTCPGVAIWGDAEHSQGTGDKGQLGNLGGWGCRLGGDTGWSGDTGQPTWDTWEHTGQPILEDTRRMAGSLTQSPAPQHPAAALAGGS